MANSMSNMIPIKRDIVHTEIYRDIEICVEFPGGMFYRAWTSRNLSDTNWKRHKHGISADMDTRLSALQVVKKHIDESIIKADNRGLHDWLSV